MPEFLNYHHLRYFRIIAHEKNLSRAAEKLNLSPSALSIQLKQLEESLGHALFERERRGLTLTEAGRVALEYAESIGQSGEELLDVMRRRAHGSRLVLRVGAVATLSRNFQLEFLKPVLHRPEVGVVVQSGTWDHLLLRLRSHEIDLILSNRPARRDAETPWHNHLLAEEPVSLVGRPAWKKKRIRFPDGFDGVPVILPSLESDLRDGFDRLVSSAGVRPLVQAEVDDMAMLRLLAREEDGLALVPPVVVRDEIEAGILVETHRLRDLRETFYAITPTRRFPNPVVEELVQRVVKRKARRSRK